MGNVFLRRNRCARGWHRLSQLAPRPPDRPPTARTRAAARARDSGSDELSESHPCVRAHASGRRRCRALPRPPGCSSVDALPSAHGSPGRINGSPVARVGRRDAFDPGGVTHGSDMNGTASVLSTTAIKGFAVQHPPRVLVGRQGIAGDRAFCLVDADDRLFTVRHCGALVGLAARFDDSGNRLSITDGSRSWSDEISVGAPLVVQFLYTRTSRGHIVEGPWNEVLSELAETPVRLVRLDLRDRGFDAHPLTLLSEASVRELERRAGVPIDFRRFRMSIGIAGLEPHEEDTWHGRLVQIGSVVLRVGGPVPRCAATTRHPETGHRDLDVVRMIKGYRGVKEDEFGQGVHFGVYAEVERPGTIAVGDSLHPA
jgi:MOSC domain-containing protein